MNIAVKVMGDKKNFIIHRREKRFKHKIIIMSCQLKFVSRLFR